jgi:hypothetical protein
MRRASGESDSICRQAGAVATVETPDLRAGLSEPGVVGGDGQVAHQMEDVAPADGVAGNHGHDRLGKAPDLDLEIEHVEASDALPGHGIVADVAVVPPDLLVAARAEGIGTLAGEDDGAHRRVVAGDGEGVGQLEESLRPERVSDLGPGDGQLGDALRHVDVDVLVHTTAFPCRQWRTTEPLDRIDRWPGDHRLGQCARFGPTPVGLLRCNHSTIHS